MRANYPLSTRTCIVLIVTVSLLSSCGVIRLEGSFDSTDRHYTGNSYANRYRDAGKVGMNLGIMWEFGNAHLPSPVSDAPSYTPVNENSVYNNYVPGDKPAEKPSFTDNIKLLTGLEMVMKNSKDAETKINASYLEVPVYGVYAYPLKSGANVFGGLGPYFAYGIGGKTKGPGYSEKTFDKEFGLKRFDAGITFTAGYQLPMGAYARIGVDLGLTDIDRIDGDKTKNSTFSIAFAYPLSGLMKKNK